MKNSSGTNEFTTGEAADISGADQAPSPVGQMIEQEYNEWFGILHDLNIGSRLGDFIWLDINRNGIQDVDQEGMENVTVYLNYNLDNFRIPRKRMQMAITVSPTWIQEHTT